MVEPKNTVKAERDIGEVGVTLKIENQVNDPPDPKLCSNQIWNSRCPVSETVFDFEVFRVGCI